MSILKLFAILTLLGSCQLVSPSGALSADAEYSPTLASDDWSVSSGANSVAKAATKESVNAFLKFYIQDYSGIDEGGELNSFSFADLRGNGVLSLVAAEGIAGRPSWPAIYIVDKTKESFEKYFTSAAMGSVGEIASNIIDLGHDGKFELVLQQEIGISPSCTANYPVIYAWTGNDYMDVSAKFKPYYQKTLDSLNTQIKSHMSSKGGNERNVECLRAEAAKIERFLGFSSTTGMAQAIRLSTSKYEGERTFAVALFTALATPEAKGYLRNLSHDRNSDVATTAKGDLNYLAEISKPSAHPIGEFPPFKRLP